MKKYYLQVYTITFIVLFSVSAFAQNVYMKLEQELQPDTKPIKTFKFSIEAEIVAYFGYTLYQIGGTFEGPDGTKYKYWFPISELKFPLDIFMFSGDIKGELFERFILHTNIKKNITSDAGKMKDSDWGVFSGDPNSLEIYSESDARLDAFIINTDFQIRTFSNSIFTLLAGAGFLYQNFQYDVRNVNQTSVNPAYTGHVSGKVLTYEIDFYIPYMEVTPCFNIKDNLKITHKIAISPYLIAKDVDDHLLRYKKSKGDARGAAFITSLKTEYYLNQLVYFNLTLNYTYIYAEGWQKQYQYKEYFDGTDVIPVGPIGKIENKIKSSQYSVVINLGKKF